MKRRRIEAIQEWSNDDVEEKGVINLVGKSDEEKDPKDEKTSPKKDEHEDNMRLKENQDKASGYDDKEDDKSQ